MSLQGRFEVELPWVQDSSVETHLKAACSYNCQDECILYMTYIVKGMSHKITYHTNKPLHKSLD